MTDPKGLYTGGRTPAEELDRQVGLDYPGECALRVLGPVKGRLVLDAGSGGNLALGKGVNAAGGTYVALDVVHGAVDKQVAGGHMGIRASIDAIPQPNGSYDDLVTANVLGHLTLEQRAAAIEEMLRVARSRVIVMNFDWDGWQGPDSVMGFKALSGELAARSGFDGYYGKLQEAEIRVLLANDVRVRDVNTFTIHRDAGVYFDEMFGLAKMNISKAGDDHPELRARLEAAVEAMQADANRPEPPLFTTPDIVVTIIYKLP